MVKWGRDRSGGATGRFMNTLGTNTGVNHTSTCESSKKSAWNRHEAGHRDA